METEPHSSAETGQESRAALESIRARNFSEIRNLANFPSDQELADFLAWQKENPYKRGYSFWCSQRPREQDLQFLTPLGGIVFYDQLANLLQEKVKIIYPEWVPSLNDDGLERCRTDYINELATKNESFRMTVLKGLYPDKYSPLFKLAESSAGLLSNFDSWSASFVVYRSSEVVSSYASAKGGKFLSNNQRIYINPHPGRTISLAKTLIERFEQPDEPLPVHLKIFNRATEAGRQRLSRIRSEGLVVYAPPERADEVLDIVLNCYRQNYLDFTGRPATKLATPIAEGISAASEKGFDSTQQSFVGHRAELIDKAYLAYQFQPGDHSSRSRRISDDLELFKKQMITVFNDNGVDLHNIAFPADK